MVTISMELLSQGWLMDVNCLKDDPKPLAAEPPGIYPPAPVPIPNGTLLRELDTGACFRFDEEHAEWIKQPSSGGDLSAYRTAAAQDVIDNTILGNFAMIESSPATQAHAVGDYIVWNGQLYKVTAAITQGESLAVGANIRSSKVADQIRMCATGSKVVNPNGNDYVYFLNEQDVLNALGRTEVNMNNVCVTAQNGDYDAANVIVIGVSHQRNTFVAHLGKARTGNMMITYAIFYSD